MNKDHRHTGERTANECIGRHQRREIKPQNSWSGVLLEEVLNIWRGGNMTQKEIGLKYGVSSSRICAVIQKAERRERWIEYLEQQKQKGTP